MENYKIKVNNEAEFNEICNLSSKLGYPVPFSYSNASEESVKAIYLKNAQVEWTHRESHFDYEEAQMLTIPQLRDLVVLHRNDLNERTHVYTTSSCEDLSAILLGDWWHIFTGGSWQKFTHKDSEKSLLMDRIQPKAEQGLISGADDAELVQRSKQFITSTHLNRHQAAQAHLDGCEVQFMTANGDFIDITDNSTLGIFSTDGGYSFRLKPSTIKLEIEIPAPFEPKDKEEAWCLDGYTLNGYRKIIFDDFDDAVIGFWRTEEEIKQVAAAWRGGIKG